MDDRQMEAGVPLPGGVEDGQQPSSEDWTEVEEPLASAGMAEAAGTAAEHPAAAGAAMNHPGADSPGPGIPAAGDPAPGYPSAVGPSAGDTVPGHPSDGGFSAVDPAPGHPSDGGFSAGDPVPGHPSAAGLSAGDPVLGGTAASRHTEGRKSAGEAAGTASPCPDARKRGLAASELRWIEREQELRRRILIVGGGCGAVLAVILAIVIALRLTSSPSPQKPETPAQAPATTISVRELVPVEEPQNTWDMLFGDPGPGYTERISILGTGDNIIHESIYRDAATGDGGYDFSPCYEKVRPYIEEADIASVNQESPLASELYSVSGYPAFNSPVQVADALNEAGFDVLNLANNHILDQGQDGLNATLEYLMTRKYRYFGAYYSIEERATPTVLTSNGIRVAFVGTLDFTNKDPSSSTEALMIWNDNDESIRKAIEDAKEAADIVVVYSHWGEENQAVLTPEMTELAQKMADWGADLIFGDHTHVVQEVRVLTRAGDGKKVPVQYGGGNFLSAQEEADHLLSILTTAYFAKNPDTGDVVCTGLMCRPLVTHYGSDKSDARVYALSDYTEELAAQHGVSEYEGQTMSIDALWDWVRNMVPEEYLAS